MWGYCIHHKEMGYEDACGYISLTFELERTKKFGIHKKAGYFVINDLM
jgi:hypothetical protein